MGAPVEIGDQPLLLFDGVCNLCNGAVNFVIDRDKDQQIKFASLQSKLGQQISEVYKLPSEDFQSMILLKSGKIYLRSNAALEVSRYLTGGWPLFLGFKIVPRFLRDWIYRVISDNRYRWFGKKDQCRIPTPELKNRFLSV